MAGLLNPMLTPAIIPPPLLIREIARLSELDTVPETGLLAEQLKTRFGESLVAIILYGSCLRMNQYDEGVIDLYVLVDNYADAYANKTSRLINRLLPPNVFYLETDREGTTVRAKYAVISVADFRRGCSSWFHSYIWSRFAQPSRLVYVRDNTSRSTIYEMLAQALLTFLRTTLPAVTETTVNTQLIWTNGLGLTYAAELRPERLTRAREITSQNLTDFTTLTHLAAPALPSLLQLSASGELRHLTDGNSHRHVLWLWRLRRWQGLILSIIRLTKAAYTFRDCVSYAAWKIERHTGIAIKVTPELQRHPVLFGFSVLWQLIKRDGLH